MSDDTRSRLEDAGREPVPGPDPAFAEILEARLLAVAASRPPAAPTPPRRGRPVGRRRAGLGIAVAAAAVAVVGLMVTARPPAQELVAPVNVEVSLAGGTMLENPDGLSLPEGAVIRVGEGGSARIGDVLLGPGDVATVSNGRLEVERPTAEVVPGSTVTSTPRPAATPRRTPAPSQRPSPRPTATSASGRSPAPAQAPTTAPTSTPATPAPARTDAPPTATPTPTPTPAIVRPRLRARLISGPRVAVTWTATWRARSYVLIVSRSRQGPAADPAYPGSRVLGTYAAPPAAPLRFRVPEGVTETRLQVIALRRDGSVLRRSNIVTVTIPVSSQ